MKNELIMDYMQTTIFQIGKDLEALRARITRIERFLESKGEKLI